MNPKTLDEFIKEKVSSRKMWVTSEVEKIVRETAKATIEELRPDEKQGFKFVKGILTCGCKDGYNEKADQWLGEEK